MRAYFGDKISERLSSTPEGFLVAQGAPLCRSGWQMYHPSELKIPGSEAINVYRPPSEVTAPSFLASLEGKCIVDDHPRNDWVSSKNARWYCAGHVQNVRKGPALANGDITIIGDLVVTDESLIRKIEDGKRGLSVGYDYHLTANDNGTLEMRDMVANHIACVERGRAGSDFRIFHVQKSADTLNVERRISGRKVWIGERARRRNRSVARIENINAAAALEIRRVQRVVRQRESLELRAGRTRHDRSRRPRIPGIDRPTERIENKIRRIAIHHKIGST